jgi:hypothetical protein
MSVLARPNHPARLASLFAAALGGAAIVAAAAYAVGWLIRDINEKPDAVAPAPAATVKGSGGIQVLIPLENAAAFREVLGFQPVVPKTLPSTTEPEPVFATTTADAEGQRLGRVAFSATGETVDGVTGPVIVVIEAPRPEGAYEDTELSEIPGTRGLAQTIVCGGLLLDVQFYYSPAAAEGAPSTTPRMRDDASATVAALREQCR